MAMKNTNLTIDSSVSSRQSFDCFGDDLAGLLLSYLTFEEKVKLESVSKQWHRLILKTVTNIRFDDLFHQISDKSLAKLLSKCPNITRIQLKVLEIGDNYFTILSSVYRNCHQLRDIYIDIIFDDTNQSVITLIGDMFTKFSKQLQIIFVGYNECKQLDDYLVKNLKNSRNLTSFNWPSDIHICKKSVPQVYQQLTIEPIFCRLNRLVIHIFSEKMVKIFKQIVRLYGQQLASLTTEIHSAIGVNIKTIMTGLSQMTHLVNIVIDFHDTEDTYWTQLAQLLPPIGRRCRRLKKLTIELDIEKTNGKNGDNLLKTICDNFQHLKRLFLNTVNNNIDLIGCNNTMNGFKQLTHLRIKSKPMSTTDQQFIGNIVANCPRLRRLQYMGYRIDSQALKSLQRLPQLEVIMLNNVDDNDIDLNAIQKCLKNCQILINENIRSYFCS